MFASDFLDLRHHMGNTSMGKRIQTESVNFGQRLAQLRKAAGFTQVELAAELGISQRMMAYYESPTATPPANLLPGIATALGVTIDELFGRSTKRRLAKQEGDSRLRRRLLAIEKLDAAEKRQVLQLLDAFIDRFAPGAVSVLFLQSRAERAAACACGSGQPVGEVLAAAGGPGQECGL
jgi:transcriptional regulator with XRE-family HTH domain